MWTCKTILTVFTTIVIFSNIIEYSKEQIPDNLIEYFYPLQEELRPRLNDYKDWDTFIKAIVCTYSIRLLKKHDNYDLKEQEFGPSRTKPIHPRDHCPGFQCPLSALTPADKARWNLVYNYFYELYTDGSSDEYGSIKFTGWKEDNLNKGIDSFSNIFYKIWDDDLAEYAQQKAALCLTTEEDTRSGLLLQDDSPIQAGWHRNPSLYPSGSTCGVEIYDYTYFLDYNYTIQPCYDKFKVEIELPVYMRRLTTMARHVTAYGMGCGSVTRIEGLKVVRHTVCYFCPSVSRLSSLNKNGTYLPQPGLPCSGCNNYTGFLSNIKCASEMKELLGFNKICYVADKIFDRNWTDETYPECYPCITPTTPTIEPFTGPTDVTPPTIVTLPTTITTDKVVEHITLVKTLKVKQPPKFISCTTSIFFIHFLLIFCTLLITGTRYLVNFIFGTDF